ncbi:hypothetical protein UlMin_029376, partial [Ulmus minor]
SLLRFPASSSSVQNYWRFGEDVLCLGFPVSSSVQRNYWRFGEGFLVIAMENIISDLNVSKLKEDSLSKMFEALHSQANGVLLLTVQWKDIDSHFKLIRKSFQDKLEELLERENGIRAKEKQLEAKELDLNLEIGLKAKELGEIDGLIEERSNEIELKLKKLDAIDRMNVEQCMNIERNRQEVDSLELLIQEKRRELDVTVKKCSENHKWMEEKEREFDRISKSVREHTWKLKFLETSIKKKYEEAESKERELQSLCKTLKKYEDDVGFLEGKFNLIQRSIEGSNKELELKEEQLRVCRRSIDEYDKEIRQSVEKLDLIQRSIEEHNKAVDLKEKLLRACRSSIDEYDKEITQRKDKLNLIRRSIEGRNKEVELKEQQLQACQRSIDEFNQEIKLKEEELDLIRRSLGTCSSKLEVKEKKLDLVLKEVESKEKNLVSLKTLVDQCTHELEMKEGKFKGVVEELESKERSVQLKIEELDLVRKKVNEYLEEVTVKEQNFGLLHKKVEESSRELEIKEIEFQKRVNEFELRQKEFESVRNLMESGANENTNTGHSQVKVEQLECVPPTNTAIVPSPASLLHRLSKDGKCLQVLLNQHFKRQESADSEILLVLGWSSDPAKLVLDAMEGFYPSDLSGENAQFDLSIVRRSCILLLEQLMKASPQIDPRVREEAMTLAGAWKHKMTLATENYLEILGFLQLLATYRLASAFDVDELRNLLDIVYRQRQASQLQRQASELRAAALCITDKAFVNSEQAENLPSQLKGFEWLLDEVLTGNDLTEENIIAALPKPESANYVLKIMGHFFSRNWERGDIGFEASVIKRFILLFEQLIRIKPEIPIQLREDARKLAVKWKEKLRADKENSLEVSAFLQFLFIYNLFLIFNEDEILNFLELTSQNKEALEGIVSLYKIPKFIRGLIKRKKFIEAIRVSCMLKLTHKFSPKPLLARYLEDAKQHTINFSKGIPLEERNEVADKEIAALRTAFRCIIDYDLKSEWTGNILNRISDLQRIKKDRNRSANFKQLKEEQEQQASRKRTNDSFSAPEKAPQQSMAKCPRTVASTVTSCTMPNSMPAFQQMSTLFDFHGSALATDRNSQQFTSIGSNYIGSNFT